MQKYYEWREVRGNEFKKLDRDDPDFQAIATHFFTENSAEVVMERWLREKRMTSVFVFTLVKLYRTT